MDSSEQLKRDLGPGGAVLTGLGSMLGTGVFVGLGLAAGHAGLTVGWAVFFAGLVATWNGLSSAQLAAVTPVSGGTYEYAYTYLGPAWGRTAGWLFVVAKSASAAAAAIACASYAMAALGVSVPQVLVVVAALVLVAVMALLVHRGVRRTTAANALLVGVTIAALAAFSIAFAPTVFTAFESNLSPYFSGPYGGGTHGLLQATALVFVAFTGYGRIATLGEEVEEPRSVIPWAIARTIVIAGVIYLVVAIVAVCAVGAPVYSKLAHEEASPLVDIAAIYERPLLAAVIGIGGIAAMAGVLLNLLLGVSRVILAMARRGDLPARWSALNSSGRSPSSAVAVAAALTGLLCLLGSVRIAWSLSAASVLVYYAITNYAALKVGDDQRFISRFNSKLGLVSCIVLALAVEPWAWIPIAGVAIGVVVFGRMKPSE